VGADFLVHELGKRGVPVVRLNSERSPEWELVLVPGDRWSARTSGRSISSEGCAGVWWRRPEVPPAAKILTAGEADAIADQWRTFMTALATVPGPRWVSAPRAIRPAEDKAAQLATAREIGFDVPQTIWTNSLQDARSFVEACHEGAVVKSVASAWWEKDESGYFVFAHSITVSDLPSPSRIAAAPVCLQQRILPKRDVRVTVVGQRPLAAVHQAPDRLSAPLDWRRGDPGKWVPYDLPTDVGSMCVRLVELFDLRFGGIDLAVDDHGRHWFLELNPNGEWGWLQHANLPIAQALADELLR
jgi:glutathione synthase/RimK-type ligase-like ATP-grasp enzyme